MYDFQIGVGEGGGEGGGYARTLGILLFNILLLYFYFRRDANVTLYFHWNIMPHSIEAPSDLFCFEKKPHTKQNYFGVQCFFFFFEIKVVPGVWKRIFVLLRTFLFS